MRPASLPRVELCHCYLLYQTLHTRINRSKLGLFFAVSHHKKSTFEVIIDKGNLYDNCSSSRFCPLSWAQNPRMVGWTPLVELHPQGNFSCSSSLEPGVEGWAASYFRYGFYVYTNTWIPFVHCFSSKRRSFPIKTRDIWVPGIYTYILYDEYSNFHWICS